MSGMSLLYKELKGVHVWNAHIRVCILALQVPWSMTLPGQSIDNNNTNNNEHLVSKGDSNTNGQEAINLLSCYVAYEV